MLMTILEARVEPENAPTLQEEFQLQTQNVPPEIAATYLANSTADTNVWRIVTVWNFSLADLQAMRQRGTPAGVLMFRAAGAEPTLSVFEIAEHAGH
jgi:hypothetical protein